MKIYNDKTTSFISQFNLEVYYEYLDKYDLAKTWEIIMDELKKTNIEELEDTFLKFDDIGELYEIGLAYTNKIQKKELGKYYTPTDVSQVMASLLLEQGNIESLVDVACGTGNLIIEVIRQIIKEDLFDIVSFIKEGNLYLYDLDKLALEICVAKIELIIGEQLKEYINIIPGDFLNRSVKLPENCTVITNPPYSMIKDFKSTWNSNKVIRQSKDLYASFIDKILDYSKDAIIVSPQSFLVSDKFSLLREKIGNNFSGEIYSFDNVPGTLFNGRKHGVFNTNVSNGVRASISLIKKNDKTGFRLSHLIRFRSDQRQDVIDLEFLRSKLGNNYQDLSRPLKVFKELEPFVDDILQNDYIFISDLIEENPEKQKEKLKLNISTSARYFIVASKRELDRRGQFQIYAKGNDEFKMLYALLSSSYVYMWWRYFDGGILFTRRWLMRTPVKKNILQSLDKIESIVEKMMKEEKNFLSYKKNAGKNQESIKFPEKYRKELNKSLFKEDYEHFELVHRNNEVL